MIWCAEHLCNAPATALEPMYQRCYAWWLAEARGDLPLLSPCRMVEALLIVKDATTGGWPEDILRVGDNYAGRIGTGLFLDALASVGDSL